MKKTAGILLLSAMTLMTGCSGKQDSAKSGSTAENSLSSTPKRYELKSGVVYYAPMVIMGIKTVQTLYFDDYGRREARESVTDSNIMGMTSHERKMDITDNDAVISYEIEKIVNGKDETSKEATKTSMKDVREMAMQMGNAFDVEEMRKNFDYREEGTEMVAGVTGKKYSISLNKEKTDARVYGVLYKNIALKSQMAGITMQAEKIEENAAVPSSKFEVPAGYTIREVNLKEEMSGAGLPVNK